MKISFSIDNKLGFNNHIDELRRTASNKIYVLRRIGPFHQFLVLPRSISDLYLLNINEMKISVSSDSKLTFNN